MAINPFKALALKSRVKVFKEDHPDIIRFFMDAEKTVIKEGTTLKFTFTSPDGQIEEKEITFTANDMETIEMIKDIDE